MSKQAIIAIVVGVIIILGAGAAFLYSQTKSKPANIENNVAEMKEKKDIAEKKSEAMNGIADIFSRGENVKCTFSSENEDENYTGTIYVSGNNARGEFKTTTDNETTSTYMIRKDDTFFMWGDSLPTGIKIVMSIDELTNELKNPSEKSDFSKIIPDSNVDYECSSWKVDSKLFEEPSSVKFMSIEGFMGMDEKETEKESSTKTETSTAPKISCDICEPLTGDAKNLCLQNCE